MPCKHDQPKDVEHCVSRVLQSPGFKSRYPEPTSVAFGICQKLKKQGKLHYPSQHRTKHEEDTKMSDREYITLSASYSADKQKKIAKLKAVGLAEGTWNGVFYPAEELAKADLSQLVGSPLTIDHSKSLKDVVGVVKNAYFDPAAGLIVEGEIHDEGLLKKIEAGLQPGISMELFRAVEYNRRQKKSIARDIEFRRASLVLDPACKRDKCQVQIQLSEDEIEELAVKIYESWDELFKKSDLPFMVGKRIRGGFKGCIAMVKSSRGVKKDRIAGAICRKIWLRKGGSGKGKGQKAHRKKTRQATKGKAAAKHSERPSIEEIKELIREAMESVQDSESLNIYENEVLEMLKEEEFKRIEELAKYPWNQCIRDQMKQYGDKETAQRVCAAIKNRAIKHAIEYGHAETLEEAIDFVLTKAEEDKLFDYVLKRLAEHSEVEDMSEEIKEEPVKEEAEHEEDTPCVKKLQARLEEAEARIKELEEKLAEYEEAEKKRKEELFEKIKELDPSAPETLKDNEVTELEYLYNKLVDAAEPTRHSVFAGSEEQKPKDNYEELAAQIGAHVEIVE